MELSFHVELFAFLVTPPDVTNKASYRSDWMVIQHDNPTWSNLHLFHLILQPPINIRYIYLFNQKNSFKHFSTTFRWLVPTASPSEAPGGRTSPAPHPPHPPPAAPRRRWRCPRPRPSRPRRRWRRRPRRWPGDPKLGARPPEQLCGLEHTQLSPQWGKTTRKRGWRSGGFWGQKDGICTKRGIAYLYPKNLWRSLPWQFGGVAGQFNVCSHIKLGSCPACRDQKPCTGSARLRISRPLTRPKKHRTWGVTCHILLSGMLHLNPELVSHSCSSGAMITGAHPNLFTSRRLMLRLQLFPKINSGAIPNSLTVLLCLFYLFCTRTFQNLTSISAQEPSAPEPWADLSICTKTFCTGLCTFRNLTAVSAPEPSIPSGTLPGTWCWSCTGSHGSYIIWAKDPIAKGCCWGETKRERNMH